MAAPSYTKDLTDIATADEAVGWVELSGTDGDGNTYNAQGAPAYSDPEYPYIQGSFAVTQDTTKSSNVGSLAYSAGSITVPTDGAILVWHNYSSPFAFGSYAQGGYRICVGSGLSDFKVWFVGGNDKGRMPYGGFENHAVNPTVVADKTAGSPTTTLNYIGSAVYVVSGPSKGEPHQVDAMRYGRCSSIFEFGELALGYATIAGFAVQNDLQANRWGLIQRIPYGFLWKGRMQLGSVANPVDYRDTNKSVYVDWTPKVTINFNTIEVLNAASYVSMSGYSFLCIDTSTASRGRFLVTDNATVVLSECSFVDMYTFVFQSNSSLTGCTFRRCNQITQGGAIIDSCLISNSVAANAIVSANLSLITDCEFVSTGVGHAVQLTSLGAGSMTWSCNDTGYAGTNGSTGNETIFVNVSSGALTINVSAGYTTPTIRTAGAVVTVVAGAVDVSVKAVTETGANIVGARVLLKASDGTGPFPYEESITITRSGSIATVTHVGHGMATNDWVAIVGSDQYEYNGPKQITYIGVNSYSFVVVGTPVTPATGVITSTFVALYGLTDSNGEIATSRVYSLPQPVTGWARKSTSSPFYKQGVLSGVITTGDGYSNTAVMVSDE